MRKFVYFSGICLIAFMTSCGSAPTSRNENDKDRTTNLSATEKPKTITYSPSNENVKKWLELKEKKVEKYVKKNLPGDWNLVSTLGYVTSEGITDVKSNQKPFKTTLQFEKGGFFSTPKFTQISETTKGSKTTSGYYLVNNTNINFKAIQDDYNEMIYFVSPNLLITKYRIEELGMTIYGYNFYSKTSEYSAELDDLLKFEQAKGYVQILSVVQNLNSATAYSDLLNAYKRLEFVSLLDSSLVNLKNNEVLAEAKKLLNENFNQYKKQQLAKIEAEYKEIKKISDFDIFKDLSDKLNETQTLKEISDAFGFDNKDILALNKKLTKDYQKAHDEFAIYGKQEDYLLKSASEDYLQENMKDPDSFEFVEGQVAGKNKRGLVYKVRFRGKNSFGAKVVNLATLVLRYDLNMGLYNVVDAQF